MDFFKHLIMSTCLVLVVFGISIGSGYAAAIPFAENFDSYDNNGDPNVIPTGFNQTSGWSVSLGAGLPDTRRVSAPRRNRLVFSTCSA